MSFSEPLINDAIRVFKDENGILLTREEAISALNAFADLYLAFACGGEAEPPRALARAGPAAAGLLDSTLNTDKEK